MKRLIYTFLLLTSFCTTAAYAVPGLKNLPKADLGVKVGANFGQLSGNTIESNYSGGFLGGIFVGAHKHKIGVQAEVLVSNAKYTIDNNILNNKIDVQAVYLDIPLLFEYKLIGGKLLPKVWLMAGPQFSSIMSIKSADAAKTDLKNQFESGYFAGVAGLEVRYMRFCLGARYILGVTNINNKSATNIQDSWKNRNIQLSLGFKFI